MKLCVSQIATLEREKNEGLEREQGLHEEVEILTDEKGAMK